MPDATNTPKHNDVKNDRTSDLGHRRDGDLARLQMGTPTSTSNTSRPITVTTAHHGAKMARQQHDRAARSEPVRKWIQRGAELGDLAEPARDLPVDRSVTSRRTPPPPRARCCVQPSATHRNNGVTRCGEGQQVGNGQDRVGRLGGRARRHTRSLNVARPGARAAKRGRAEERSQSRGGRRFSARVIDLREYRQ